MLLFQYMDIIFVIKLFVLFLIGGSVIAGLSFIAEKSNSKISGIILSFPSTIVITFIFLAYTNSVEVVTKVAPSIFIPLGIGLIFPIIYIYTGQFLSKLKISKTLEVIGSFLLSTVFWIILSIPIAYIQFSNLSIGILGYLILLVIAQIILEKKKYEKVLPIKYTQKEKIGRAIFIGFILVIIAVFSKIINPFWGSIFSVFPAGVGSLLMIFHWNYSPNNLIPLVQKLPIGSLLIFIYVLAVLYFFPIIGPIIGTVISYGISLILYLGIKKILKV
jgi:hypothetical protein